VADLLGRHRRRPAETLAAGAGAGGGQALVGALDDELADELGQRGEDVEDQTATGRGGVQRLVQRAEPDAALAQPGEKPARPVKGGPATCPLSVHRGRPYGSPAIV
jgi:hypothetical protein